MLPELGWRVSANKALRFAVHLADEKKLAQVASSLTFTTVLAIVPLLAVVLALFTALPLFGEFKLALENFLGNNLMPPAVSDTVMNYLTQFAAQASRLTAIGSVFLIVTSILLMMTIDRALNDIWNVSRQRPLGRRMLVYWAILSLGPILAGASLWVTSYLAHESQGRVAQLSTVLGLALSFIPVLATALGFAAMFVMVPHRKVEWKDAFAGGFGVAIVLEIMKAGFAFYLTRFPSYMVIYGAFATLPIFLVWIYLSWLAILFGATVAATLPLMRLRRWAENRQAGASFIDAIHVIRLLRSAQGSRPPGRSARYLSTHLHLDQHELLSVLDTLKDLGYIVQGHEKGRDLWVLACDPHQAMLGPIVDALLIDRSQNRLVQDHLLLDALCRSLTQTVRLDEAIEPHDELPETPVIVQNRTMANATREISDVKSQ
ncbi:MAG: YihY family inner membrane protein [Candidimonas sp.]|nr:MAG: YihY family inner membrane protein [Candidimonas sp.]TAM26329.1 MAG: YihY family inner membrane protein [Candidimonas sp.]TAM75150.1 MAG: YihY family inner membrane protein [Candidimonas sp.]